MSQARTGRPKRARVPGEAGWRAAGCAAALGWVLAGITAVILAMAGDGVLMTREMQAFAPAEATGLPAAEYEGVGAMLAGYLTDRTDRFQYAYRTDAGAEILCFQPHEQAHMADVRALIRLDRKVLWVSLSISLLLTAAGVFSRRGRTAFQQGMRHGLALAAFLATGVGLWALISFDGLFVTFHRLAFTNDGWLLNPRTDLLIRLMPEALFADLGRKGALAAAAVLLLPVAAAFVPWEKKRRRGNGGKEGKSGNDVRGARPLSGREACRQGFRPDPGAGDQL